MSTVERAYERLSRNDAAGARAILQEGADAGEVSSLVELGAWLLEGRFVPRDLARSRDCFRRAAELGDLRSTNIYIALLGNGMGSDPDWPQALQWLRKLAQTDEIAERQVSLIDSMDLDPFGYPQHVPEREMVSSLPAVWTIERLLTEEECRYLIKIAQPILEPSVIVDPATGRLVPHPVRTSEGASFPFVSEDLVVGALNRRIARASGSDYRCGEPLQLLRYRPGQQYRAHLDALPEGQNQRVLTVLVYLNEGFDGGETLFTETGLSVAGRTGHALLFRNADAQGSPEPKSRHAGLPVTRGEKYLATRWIRERPLLS